MSQPAVAIKVESLPIVEGEAVGAVPQLTNHESAPQPTQPEPAPAEPAPAEPEPELAPASATQGNFSFCPECGTKNNSGAQFCGSCGHNLK